MKNLLYTACFFIIFFISCEKINNCVSIPSAQNSICIDSTLIIDNAVCTEEYDPVWDVMVLLTAIHVMPLFLVELPAM